MDRQEILQKLTELFREIFDESSIVLTEATTADDVYGWDSLNHVAIVVQTERRFGVKFQTSEIEELKNVGDFIHLIEKKLKEKVS
jgi:acyl carrier protein